MAPRTIVDFHTHIFPDAIAERTMTALSECAGIPNCTDGTASGLRASMRRNGIIASVFQQIATKPEQTPTINRWTIEQDSRDLIGFGSVHPEYPRWRDELDRLADAGVKGIKFHPDYQKFYVDEERCRPIYEHAIERGLIILFHAGIDIGLPGPTHCTPERVLAVYDTLRHGKIVLAHMGGWRMWGEVLEHLAGTSLYFDTSFCSGKFARKDFLHLLRTHGVERVLFGSDSPWEDQAASITGVEELGLSSDEEAAVLGRNALALLGRAA